MEEPEILEFVSAEKKIRFAPSLFKYALLIQTIIGATMAAIGVILIATVITISVINSTYGPPILQNDFATTYKTNFVDIPVLKNDYDLKDQKIEIVDVIQPIFGKVLIYDSKTVRYFPENIGKFGKHFSGLVEFKYIAKNEKYTSNGVVKVDVLNHPPIAVDFRRKIPKNAKNWEFDLFKMKNDEKSQIIDFDGDSLTITDVLNGQSISGTIKISSDKTKILYSTLPESVDTEILHYQISDGNDTSNGTITIQIENYPPEAKPDYFEGYQNQILKNIDILKNDVDQNKDFLKINSIRNIGLGKAVITKNGTFVDYFPTFGSYTTTFEYSISDGEYSSSSYVVISMKNQKPRISNLELNISKNSVVHIPLKYSDLDPYSSLNVKLISKPKGTVDLITNTSVVVSQFLDGVDALVEWKNNSWSINYQPVINHIYQDIIDVEIDDSIDHSNGTITINVINNAPIAVNDHFVIPYNSTSFLDLLKNDYDPNNDHIKIKTIQFPTSKGGLIEIVNDTTVQYKPKFYGHDSFNYTITDIIDNPENEMISHRVTVEIFIINVPPIANNDIFAITGEETSLNVLKNDIDINNDSLTIASVDQYSKNGILLKVENNKVTYPRTDFLEKNQDSFSYFISDGEFDSNVAMVSLIFANSSNSKHHPICKSFSKTIFKSTLYSWDLMEKGVIGGTNKENLRIHIVSLNDSKGDVTVQNSTLIFKSYSNRSGAFNFKFYVNDGSLNSSICNISLNIENKKPVAIDDHKIFFKQENKIYLINALENDVDLDGDLLKITSVSNSKSIILLNNSLSFQPNLDFNSSLTDFNISYSISDQDLDNPKTDQGMIFLTFLKSLPIVKDDLFYVDQNTNALIKIEDLLKNDYSNDESEIIQFNKLVDCNELNNSDFCLKKPLLNLPSDGFITVPYTMNSCKQNKFKYCVNTNTNKKAISCGTVTIRYKNCICQQPIDIVYTVDSSGSISNNQWNLQMDFILNVTKKLIINDSQMNVGLIQFGENVKNISLLTSDKRSIQNSIESIRNHHMSSWTNTLGALNEAVKILNFGNPLSLVDRSSVSKIILLLTDGLANVPCNCNSCSCESVFCVEKSSTCKWNPDIGGFCQPCADPSIRSGEINSWKNPDWKIIALGIGEELSYYEGKGLKMVKKLNYDDELISTPWDKLDHVITRIVDQSCNI
eukprot:gene8671-618_t